MRTAEQRPSFQVVTIKEASCTNNRVKRSYLLQRQNISKTLGLTDDRREMAHGFPRYYRVPIPSDGSRGGEECFEVLGTALNWAMRTENRAVVSLEELESRSHGANIDRTNRVCDVYLS